MVQIRKYAKSHDHINITEDFGTVDITKHIGRNRKERRIIEAHARRLVKRAKSK